MATTTTATTIGQLQLWPGLPGGRCPLLCRSRRPTPATCGKCAVRIARVTGPQLTWAEERALMRRELVRLAAERTAAERAHTERLHRLARRARWVRRREAAGPPSGARPLHRAAVPRGTRARRAHGR